MEGLTIRNTSGSALYCRSGTGTSRSSPTIRNCIFLNNTAERGGAIYNSAGTGDAITSPTIINCLFIDNTASSNAGAIYNSAGTTRATVSPTIINCLFIDNTASSNGGAIYNRAGTGDATTSPTIINCLFIDNTASSNGGAIYNSAGTGDATTSPTIINCLFVCNKALSDGGAIYNFASTSDATVSPTITNCLFVGNKALSDGGAIYNLASIMRATVSPTIINCTFSGNFAENGGGIYAYNNKVTSSARADVTVANCIFWENVGGDVVASDRTVVSYCCTQGSFSKGIGNISTDPYFVDPGYWDANGTPDDANDDFWVTGDYHLKSEGWRWDTNRKLWTWDDVTSRCIDAGNPGSPLADEPLSIPDDPNKVYGKNIRINMGAYGGTAQASMPPYDWAVLADLNNDGTANFIDLAHWAQDWLSSGSGRPGDLDRNRIVDIADFALLARHWLGETTWHQ